MAGNGHAPFRTTWLWPSRRRLLRTDVFKQSIDANDRDATEGVVWSNWFFGAQTQPASPLPFQPAAWQGVYTGWLTPDPPLQPQGKAPAPSGVAPASAVPFQPAAWQGVYTGWLTPDPPLQPQGKVRAQSGAAPASPPPRGAGLAQQPAPATWDYADGLAQFLRRPSAAAYPYVATVYPNPGRTLANNHVRVRTLANSRRRVRALANGRARI